ncbi:hypothetical protein CYMTET_14614 [Cymbomonas tetramitiformis]|uniref:SET domain-containing protein n=1 Tax=Cymbomonas tetramitiformis TaxID=36881 RepID=A0AAE0GFR1_9CHLO|nr:hypothetical protein CYMTET_14614 [Cymbomonas tetramitiformis]
MLIPTPSVEQSANQRLSKHVDRTTTCTSVRLAPSKAPRASLLRPLKPRTFLSIRRHVNSFDKSTLTRTKEFTRPICAVRSEDVSSSAAASTFAELAAEAGLSESPDLLELGDGEFGRGLFATKDLPAGTLLLTIPLNLCMIAQREDAISVPGACWNELTSGTVTSWPRLRGFYDEYPLPWDVRLATALLDTMEGNSDSFWDRYSEWLPRAEELPCLVSFTEGALEELHDSELQQLGSADQATLRRQCSALDDQSAAPGSLVGNLQWGVACARSRAFEAAPGVFALVPLVDMVNHAFQDANADVQLALGSGASEEALLNMDGHFELRLKRDVAAGQEVLVSYGCNDFTNAQLLIRYGFVKQGNAFDRLSWDGYATWAMEQALLEGAGAEESDEVTDAEEEDEGEALPAVPELPHVSLRAVEAALSKQATAQGERWMRMKTQDASLKAGLGSLPASAHEARAEEELSAARMLRAYTQHLLTRCSTTLDIDLDIAVNGTPIEQQGLPDAQRLTAVQYRVERKTLLNRIDGMLETYINSLSA